MAPVPHLPRCLCSWLAAVCLALGLPCAAAAAPRAHATADDADPVEGPPSPRVATDEPGGADARALPNRSLREAVAVAIERHPLSEWGWERLKRPGVRRGLLAAGGYRPPGAFIGGIPAPPLRLYPGAGFGNSLNINPWTGQPY